MAKSTLPVDFTDDVLNESMSGKRRYKLIYNDDGTVSLDDVTAYDQIGSDFGSKQLNETNTAVNAAADAGKIIDSLATVRAVTQEGYMAGALALKELDDSLGALLWTGSFTEGSITVPNLSKYRIIAVSVEGILCFGTKSYGGTCIPLAGQLGIVNYAYRFSYNSDVLTINDNNKGGTNGTSQKIIQAIYGIVLN